MRGRAPKRGPRCCGRLSAGAIFIKIFFFLFDADGVWRHLSCRLVVHFTRPFVWPLIASLLVSAMPAPAEFDRLLGVISTLTEVLRFHIADVQKPVAADAEIDKGRLNAGLDVHHAPLVNVADVIVGIGAFDVQLLQKSVFNDRNPTFLGLRHVD